MHRRRRRQRGRYRSPRRSQGFAIQHHLNECCRVVTPRVRPARSGNVPARPGQGFGVHRTAQNTAPGGNLRHRGAVQAKQRRQFLLTMPRPLRDGAHLIGPSEFGEHSNGQNDGQRIADTSGGTLDGSDVATAMSSSQGRIHNEQLFPYNIRLTRSSVCARVSPPAGWNMTSFFGKIVLSEHNFSRKARKGTMLPQASLACIWSNGPFDRPPRNSCYNRRMLEPMLPQAKPPSGSGTRLEQSAPRKSLL